MADAIVPDEAELEGLSNPPVQAPGDTMPDPEPEVLARAQELINRAGDGEQMASMSDSAEPVAREVVNPLPELTDSQKLRFMAHVLANKPYTESFKAMNGEMTITFRSLSAEEEQILSRMVLKDERDELITKDQRRARYHQYALAGALERIDYEGGATVRVDLFRESAESLVEDGNPDGARDIYAGWVRGLSGLQLRIIDRFYQQFVTQLNQLLERVDDPNFWPTPSSP